MWYFWTFTFSNNSSNSGSTITTTISERERNISVQEIHQSVTSHMPLAGDLAPNPGMCPDWESNQWPFGSQARI